MDAFAQMSTCFTLKSRTDCQSARKGDFLGAMQGDYHGAWMGGSLICTIIYSTKIFMQQRGMFHNLIL